MEKTAEQLRREHIALEGDTHGKNKWAILFTVLVMTFMVCLDSTVVTVALPSDAKGAGRGPRSHSAGELGVSACDVRGYVAVWPLWATCAAR